jgi:Tol biopolymer transport system component
VASPSSYLDFDLLIEPAGQGYRARVIHSPAGQAEADFTMPFSEQDLQMLVLQVFRLSARRSVRTIASPELREIRSFGTRLYGAVFGGAVQTCLLRSLDKARSSRAGLRVRIHLGDVPALSNVPWEFLYDAGADEFLCLSDQTPLIRYMDLAQAAAPLSVTPPLRVLTVVSSPAGYPALDVEKEWDNVNQALRAMVEQGRVAVERLETPTLEALQQRLRRADYHVLHFIGHGTFDDKREDGVLLFEDLAGKGDPVGAESLGVLLNDHESLRLVLLNACEGARTSATDPFAGTAQSLVRKGIPAVIAMQFEVTDEAAKALSKEFYNALADGWPIDAALAEARKAVFTRVNAVEWATPVLYMRAPDGRIFDVQPSAAPVVEMVLPPEPKPEPEPQPKPEQESGAGKLRQGTPPPEDEEPVPQVTHEETIVPLWRRAAIPAGVAAAVLIVAIVLVSVRPGKGTKVTPTTPGQTGQGLITVPQVSGLLAAEATSQLEELGLKVKRVDRPSIGTPIGEVAAVTPGGQLQGGSSVTMYVSTGAWIAYISDKKDTDPLSCDANCNWDIYLTQADGSTSTKLVAGSKSDQWPAWSRDGSKIAFSSNRGGDYEIYVIDSDGTNLKRLTTDPGTDRYPTWSPDGQSIAFTSDRSGNEDIWVMKADGTDATQLTTDPLPDEGPRWSRHHSSIAFFRGPKSGPHQIYLIDVDSRSEQNISNSQTDDVGPAWNPDGTMLAFRRGNGDIWVMDTQGKRLHQLTDTGQDAQPTWSPDGQSIAFRSRRDGSEDIWVMSAVDGTNPRNLTNTPDVNEERPVWWP